jgi:hypothetical protein
VTEERRIYFAKTILDDLDRTDAKDTALRVKTLAMRLGQVLMTHDANKPGEEAEQRDAAERPMRWATYLELLHAAASGGARLTGNAEDYVLLAEAARAATDGFFAHEHSMTTKRAVEAAARAAQDPQP